ncbi:MAG: anaerobic ribonucleoside-triphosphate reductase activating protein [Clostridia bacterium]|nr:anaerobic ribonucleoside-triphosphate reductase activating protein [Clostridia bacterium]
MYISGLQKLTLLDFPGRLAATVFLGGCNFRCPFCHNASLVLSPSKCEKISEEEFFSFLNSRKGKLGGVCITGGEPTLYPDLKEFIKKIKDAGFAVKLDTNGTNPDLLSSLISERLVDYVAMDIKNSIERYEATVGTALDIEKVKKSVDILLSGKVDYEFRTTVVKELHRIEDFVSVSNWISGAKRYFLQTFEDSGDLIGSGFSSYSREETEDILNAILPSIPNAQIRS